VHKIFTPGATTAEIVEWVRGHVGDASAQSGAGDPGDTAQRTESDPQRSDGSAQPN
jgi:hypothetical protein